MNIVLPIGRELQDPWSLTGCHAELHTWIRYFCTARALSVCRQLPVGEQRSLSPGNQPGWQSDFLLGAERPVTSWRPRCSFCAVPSICRPAQIMQKKKRVGKRQERLVTLCQDYIELFNGYMLTKHISKASKI